MTNSMKEIIYNKRGIMEFAHRMWVERPMTFGERLRAVWALAKVYMGSGKVTGQFIMYKPVKHSQTFEEGIQEYYNDKPSGAYTGD